MKKRFFASLLFSFCVLNIQACNIFAKEAKTDKINGKTHLVNGITKIEKPDEKLIKKFFNKNITLNVAISADFPPFESLKNGKIVGIDADILDAISKETGIKFIFNDMAFSSIIASLNSGKTQLAISGMGATEDRKKSLDFSEAYYRSSCIFLSKKSSKTTKTDFFKIIDLSLFSGKKVISQTGTTMQIILQEYNKMAKDNDKIEPIFVDANSVGVEMLLNDKADAFLIDDIVGEVYLKIHKNVLEKADAICDLEDGFSIAFPKNSAYFKTINEALKKINKNGTVKKIVNSWKNKYTEDFLKEEHNRRYKQSLLFIVKGSLLTLQYAMLSIVFGMILAIFISLLMYSGNRFLHFFSKVYISVIRGTPLLLQLSFFYFGLSNLLGLNLSIFVSGLIAFSINSSAYVAEIIRSGIRAIDKGQFDACRSLNLSKFQTIKDIVIPQVLHNIFPALINEFISLIKESSLISVLGGYEIMKRTNLVIAEHYTYFLPLIVAGLTYYFMTFILECFSHWWEKKYRW